MRNDSRQSPGLMEFAMLVSVAFAAMLFVTAALLLWHSILSPQSRIDLKKFPRKFPDERWVVRDHFDVIVVGAGPSGATLGYYLAKMKRKVLLLEKKKFPRDKYCGDAVCKTGIEILKEMGIYEKLLRENKAKIADSGGMCSPGGLSFVMRSKDKIGDTPAAIACKRIHLDEEIVKAAETAGATLLEESAVSDAKLDRKSGLWTVFLEGSERTFTGRVLVCADGAPSKLAGQLGIVMQPPQGICSRSYVEAGTHRFQADGVVFYTQDMMPGYAAMFRHPNNELGFCCYLIPGNPKISNDDMPYWHDFMINKDPRISRALKNSKMERMKAGSLRIGGEKRTYDDHVLVVGDAAGMIDPLTGEGIHHAQEGGKIAAEFLNEALQVGNFDAELMKEYQNRWMNRFGYDFKWSMAFSQMLYRYPILVDAATAAIIRKGEPFLLYWAEIMTGRISKINLLRPKFVIVVAFELILLLGKRMLGQELKLKKPE